MTAFICWWKNLTRKSKSCKWLLMKYLGHGKDDSFFFMFWNLEGLGPWVFKRSKAHGFDHRGSTYVM